MPHSGAGSRARRGACYCELPRIGLPRTSLNKGKIRGAGAADSPGPLLTFPSLANDPFASFGAYKVLSLRVGREVGGRQGRSGAAITNAAILRLNAMSSCISLPPVS